MPPELPSERSTDIIPQTLTISGLAGRYATALFDLAQERDKTDSVAQGLNTLDAMLAESPDLARLTQNPVLDATTKGRALAALVAAAGLDPLVANFIAVVSRGRRLDQLAHIITAFNRIHRHHKGEVSAHVVSAHKLTKAQQDALNKKLTSLVGSDVTVDTAVDDSLLGGMVVKIGSRMIDSSLTTKLANLEESMKEVG